MLAINVAGLLRSTAGTTRSYPVSDLRLELGDERVQGEPLRGLIALTRTNRGLLVEGKLETSLIERCDRCLTAVVAPVAVELREEALPTLDIDSGQPLDVAEEPDVLRIDAHHVLDLEPTVVQAVSLAEPMKVLCREACAGLCSRCGRDLNLEPHEHKQEPDPRLAPLARLLDQKKE